MRFPEIHSVILFGGAPLLVAAAHRCRERGLAVHIFTAPRHEAEVIDRQGRSLGTVLADAGFDYVVSDDICKQSGEIAALVDNHCLGIGIGEAWSFPAEMIALFDNRLLDFMGIPHPRYRGGAHYTWMILRSDRQMGCNLQIINKDMVQGEHDSGDIVIAANYELPDSVRTPQDYFDAAVPHEVSFIESFLDRVATGDNFDPFPPDENRSLFLPRLHTGRNGWIDWCWSGRDIERFICAFDRPYIGAGSYCDGTLCRLRSARLVDDEPPFHPFQSGLITRVHAGAYYIATSDGHLRVDEIHDDGGLPLPLAVGQRLFTPRKELERALCERANYGT